MTELPVESTVGGRPRRGVGIVGFGPAGIHHARAFSEMSDEVDLIAFSGGSTQLASEEGWPEAVKLTPEEVLQHPEIEIVAVCSPSSSHAELALASLEAGKHVVVEKPLALTVADAERVADRAEKYGLQVSVISQRRFEPDYLYLEQQVRSGALGDLRLASAHVHWYRDDTYYASASWRTSQEAGGGSLMNQGVHSVDLLRWLAGPVDSLTAQYGATGHELDMEDTTVATVRFTSGALGLISTSTATPPGTPSVLSLHFSRGVVVLGQGEVVRWDVDGVPPPPESSARIASGAALPTAIGHHGHLAQWRDVLGALGDGTPPAIGPADGVETVRLLCGIYEAARTGRRVRPAEL